MSHHWIVSMTLAAALAGTAFAQPRRSTAPWRNNVNLPGGDYRSIDMNTSDPARCKAACEKDGRCEAWTFVKPEEPGGRGYCWLKDSVPEAITEDCCVSALKGEGVSGGGSAGGWTGGGTGMAGRWRNNIDLPGGDYRSVEMDTSDPGGCKALCDREGKCRAWTFVKPEEAGGRGLCWLKDSVPEAVRDNCCMSAVKGAPGGAPTTGALGGVFGTATRWRNNINLPGGDYRSIDMNTADPTACRDACEREGRCKAWTLVKPDEGGRSYCWLKDSIPEAVRDECCVSSVKGGGVSGGGWPRGRTR